MTPKQHYEWTKQVSAGCVEIEILELVKLAPNGKKIIVDTKISSEILRKISDYHHVAILLCDPPDITSKKFFDRDDPEKQFMLNQIKLCKDPKATLQNLNAWALYHPENEIDWNRTGFFTYTRSDFENDTKEEMLKQLVSHFGLA